MPTARHPGARRALALLLAINLFNYIDRFILAAVEPELRRELFAGDADARGKSGMLVTAFLVSYMVAAPLFGWLADRRSRWVLVGAGVAVWSLASGATGLAGAFLALLATRVVVGVGEAAYGPAAPTLLADYFPASIRARVLSLFYLAIPLGSALGFVLGGMAGAAFGWRWPFYLVTLPGLLLAGLCCLMREPREKAEVAEVTDVAGKPGVIASEAKQPPRPASAVRLPFSVALTRLLANRSWRLNTAAMTAMTFVMGGLAFWMPGYIHEFRGQPDLGRVSTMVGAVTVASGLCATLAGGWLADWLKTRVRGANFLVSGATMWVAFPLMIAMLFAPFPWFWGLFFLVEFFLFFNTGPANAALVDSTEPRLRSMAFAVNIFVIHALGDAIAPPLLGAIADRWQMNAAFLAASALVAVSGTIWLWGARGAR